MQNRFPTISTNASDPNRESRPNAVYFKIQIPENTKTNPQDAVLSVATWSST